MGVHSAADNRSIRLTLFGGFALNVSGEDISLPLHARRVLAYLSLNQMTGDFCDRTVLADRLWPDRAPDRSRASLRTALWRIRASAADLVTTDSTRARLGDTVRVDVHDMYDCTEGVIDTARPCGPAELRMLTRGVELLPEWPDDWLLLAREQLRQLRLHALEVTARQLLEQGRCAQAIDVILPVVGEEPLRESAQEVLIDAHLGEGNTCEAIRQYLAFAAVLCRELNLTPSAELRRKVGLPSVTRR